jgi:sulfatase modifying factor 1
MAVRFFLALYVFMTIPASVAFGQSTNMLFCNGFEEGYSETCFDQGPCPQGMAPIGDFCIDRWEASIVNQSPYYSPEPPSPGKIAKSEPGVVPQGYINGILAAGYCASAGKRLCTSQEWLRTCAGPEGWTYPYGNTYREGACNDYRAEHPLTTLYGPGNENWSDVANPLLNQLPDTVDLTGKNTLCVTPEGVYDLVGNLHEWVEDASGVFRGGYYVEGYINGNGCQYVTTAHNVSHWDFSTGFRCCLDP